MKTRNKAGNYEQKHRNDCRKPFVKLLVAQWDKDPAAVMIDVTPVDLSDSGCCPYCGNRTDEPPTPRG
jgi:hypothetical protein